MSDTEQSLRNELRQVREALCAEQRVSQTLKYAFEETSDGVAITDAEGRFISMNAAHLQMFGYDLADVLHQPWSILYTPENAERVRSRVMPLIGANGYWRGELLGLDKTGRPVPQDVSLTLLSNGGLLCSTRDLTNQLKTETERASLAVTLRAAEHKETVSRLAEQFAHDIGNLLAAIRFSSVAIVDHEPITNRIDRALDQAGGLLVKLSKLHEWLTPETESCSLKDIAEDCLHLGRAMAPGNVSISLFAPPSDVRIEVDRSLLERTLLNLVKNSIEAVSLDGAIEIHVLDSDPPPKETHARSLNWGERVKGGSAWLAIRDDGPGMSAEHLAKMEQAGVTTKIADRDMLRGLGFSSLTTLVRVCKAYAEIRTVEGEGTSVYLQLPLAR